MEPTPTPSPSASLGPGDFFSGVGQLLSQLSRIEQLISPPAILNNLFAHGIVEPIFTWLTGFLASTQNATKSGGPFTQQLAIEHYEPLASAVANGALVGVLVWSSYRLMWSQSVRPRYSAHLILPRLLVAFVLINFALPLFQAAVDMNNKLCQAVLMAAGPNLVKDTLGQLVGDSSKDLGSGPGLTVVITVVVIGGFLLLSLAYLVRYALLVILAVTAPLAALALVLPETHEYARKWTGLFVASLFMQPLQLLIIAISFALEAEGGWPIRHAFALAALWIAFKVPGALHDASSLGTHATTIAKRDVGKLFKTAAKGVA